MTLDVYQPREDSVLLAQVVERYDVECSLEVGVGSGFVTVGLARRSNFTVGTDIDRRAVDYAAARIRRLGLLGKVNLILCEGATPFRHDAFDLVVFNPPYLPSDKVDDPTIDGGEGGVAVAERLLEQSFKVAKKDGRVAFIVSSLSRSEEMLKRIKSGGCEVKIVKSKKLFFEEMLAVEAIAKA